MLPGELIYILIAFSGCRPRGTGAAQPPGQSVPSSSAGRKCHATTIHGHGKPGKDRSACRTGSAILFGADSLELYVSDHLAIPRALDIDRR
jgi:hypothetical protein